MKKQLLTPLFVFFISLSFSQNVIFSISASKNEQTTHLDSILFENLNNESQFVLKDLPNLSTYDVDISTQLLITHVEQIGLPEEGLFRLIRNIPGEVSVQYNGKTLENVMLNVYNMAGQSVFTQDIRVLNQHEILNVGIPDAGIYLIRIATSAGSYNYKAIGSAHSLQGNFTLSTSQQSAHGITYTPIETNQKSAPLDDGFLFQIGDSIRITAFLDGYTTTPHTGKITASLTIHFVMQLSDDMDGNFTDSRDGNMYTWVKIGNQVWMAENLKYLPAVIGPGAGSETTPHYYVYDYNGTDVIAAKATANYQDYGALYNWPAAMNGAQSSSANPSTVQGVCPTGWHLPSDAEWTQLVSYVVAQGYANESTVNGAGNALKSCRQVNSPVIGNCNTSDHPRWESHGTHYGTDVFGFAAHGGGFRHSNGEFPNIAVLGFWWSATGVSSTEAFARAINRGLGAIFTDDLPMSYAYSVRCIRD